MADKRSLYEKNNIFNNELKGFKKKQVIEYISNLENAHREKVEAYESEKAKMQAEIDSLNSQYAELLEKELINSSFGTEHFWGRGFNMIIFGGESEKPEEVKSAILERIAFLKENGIEKDEVQLSLFGHQDSEKQEKIDKAMNLFKEGKYEECIDIISKLKFSPRIN